MLFLVIASVSPTCDILVLVQLEKLIGKVKTDKYGNDIIEVMWSAAEGGKDSGANGAKRQRKDKDVVSVESSEEEA
jgi:ATP-dependent DNA helicase Q1